MKKIVSVIIVVMLSLSVVIVCFRYWYETALVRETIGGFGMLSICFIALYFLILRIVNNDFSEKDKKLETAFGLVIVLVIISFVMWGALIAENYDSSVLSETCLVVFCVIGLNIVLAFLNKKPKTTNPSLS